MTYRLVNSKIAFVIGVLLLCTILFTSSLLWLATGKRTIPLISAQIEKMLDSLSDQYDFSVGEISLSWKEGEGNMRFEIAQVKMYDVGSKAPIAVVSDVTIVPVFSSLLVGELLIDQVILSQPHLNVKNILSFDAKTSGDKAGEIILAAQESGNAAYQKFMVDILKVFYQSRRIPINKVTIKQASLDYDNGENILSFLLPSTDVTFLRERRNKHEVILIGLDTVLYYQDKPIILNAEGIFDQEGQLSVESTFLDISLDDIRKFVPQFRWLNGVEQFFRGRVKVNIANTGVLSGAKLYLNSMRKKTEKISAYLSARFEEKDGKNTLRNISVKSRVKQFDVSKLGLYWPEELEPLLRGWVVDNIREGNVSEAGISVVISPEELARGYLDDSSLRSEIVFNHATLAAFGEEAPFVHDITGKIAFSGNKMTLSEAEGKWENTVLTEVRGEIRDLADVKKIRMGITGKATGKVADLVSIGKMASSDADYLEIEKGEAVSEFYIGVPLYEDVIDASNVVFNGISSVTNVVFEDKKRGNHVWSKHLDVALDFDKSIWLRGHVVANGMEGDLRVWQKKQDAHTEFSTTLSHAQLAEYNTPLLKVEEGEVPLTVLMAERGGASSMMIEAKLNKLDIDVPYVNYTPFLKKDAVLTAFLQRDEALIGNNLQLYYASEDASFSGEGYLDEKQGTFSRLSLVDVKYGLSHVNIDYTQSGYNQYIQIKGRSFDATSMVMNVSDMFDGLQGEGVEANEDMLSQEINMSVDKVFMPMRYVMDNVKIYAKCGGKKPQCAKIDFVGKIMGREGVTLRYDDKPITQGEPHLNLTMQNVGILLKMLGLSNRVIGGVGTITANVEEGKFALQEGKIVMRDLKVVKAVLLGKLLNILSMDILDLLNGKGIGFSSLKGGFSFKNGVLELDKLLATGTSLGINASGTVDFTARQYDLGGAIIPAYVVNSLLGNIPLIGPIFVGKEGEGVIATRYSAKGDYNDPQISVNPLSMLTPGFLRHLWGGK